MPVASSPNRFPIIGRRDVGSAAHGLSNHRGDVTFFLEHILDVAGALERALGAALEWAMRRVRRRHMLGAGQERADALPKDGFAADRNGVE